MSTQQYIVVFKEGVTKEDVDKYAQQVEDNGGNVTNRYESVLNGFAAHLPESFFLSLQDDGLIDYIDSIIIFKDSASPEEIAAVMEQVRQAGGQIINTYNSVIKGFAATLSESHLQALRSITRSPNSAIKYIGS
ncbi:hypothetical protein C0991_002746 [Blastosporella zonata]|nr:hypothetical protein C0991_002746 [Blastosporella zonata]